MNLGLWGAISPKTILGAIKRSSVPADTTAPTVTITCAQSSPTATTPLNMTFTFSETVTGFTLGDITVANGTAGNFAGFGAVYTCDITPTGMSVVTVDVGAGVCVDGAGNGNTTATQFTITSTAPFTDNFTRSNGALGSIWTGATWTISSNAAINTPTLGSELLQNPGFEGTFENEGSQLDLAPNWDNFNADAGSDTLAESATAHGGSKSQQINVNANGEGVKTTATPMASIGWYQCSTWVNITSGVASLSDDEGTSIANLTNVSGSWQQIVATGRTAGTNRRIYIFANGGAANFLTDDASVKAITPSSMFATLPDVGVSNVTAQALVTVQPIGHHAGVIINMNSASNPTSFVIAKLIFVGGATSCRLTKCVSGTYTQLINTNVTFGATKNLKLVKSGDTYSVWYGAPGSETQVGTNQTIASMNGTIHGMFSTYSQPKLDTFQLSVTP